MDNQEPITTPEVPNPNNLVHWIIPAPYASRFVVDTSGRLIIEFAPGREEEMSNYMHQNMDFHVNQQKLKQVANDNERQRIAKIRAQQAKKEAARQAAAPTHLSTAPIPPSPIPDVPGPVVNPTTGIPQFINPESTDEDFEGHDTVDTSITHPNT